jgi:hypothetical protein
MAKRSAGKQPGTLVDAAVLAMATVAAISAGIGLPDVLGIAVPLHRHGTTAMVGMVAFGAGWWTAHRVVAATRFRDRGPTGGTGVAVGVLVFMAVTTWLAAMGTVRVVEVLELRSEQPRVLGIVGAFSIGLLAMQWAVLDLVRDLGPALARMRFPLRLPRPVLAAPSVSQPARAQAPLASLELGQPGPPPTVA